MTALSHAAPLVYWSVLGGLLLLAALLLTHVVISIRSALAAPASGGSEAPSPRAPRFADEAAVLAGEGHFLEAARRLQLGCIETLLDRGQLELRRFEPNRTLRRRICASALEAADRSEFVALLQRLERRYFRDREDDRALYEAWRALHARLDGGSAAA